MVTRLLIYRGLSVTGLSLLSSCAALDRSATSRVYDLNHSVDEVRNNAILLNIIRSSHREPTNFVAVSKFTDTGNLMVSAGFPSFTIGPHTQMTARDYTFGPNSASSQFATSFDLGILDTTDFYSGMSKPLDEVALNLLQSQGFQKDLLFSTVLQAVVVRDDSTGETHEYVNDPSAEIGMNCPDFDYSVSDKPPCQNNYRSPSYDGQLCQSPYGPASPYPRDYGVCPYHHFQFYIWRGLRYGLSTETRARINPEYKPGSNSKYISEGHICFDASQAVGSDNKALTAKAKGRDLGVCRGQWLRDAGDGKSSRTEAAAKSGDFPFTYFDRGQLIKTDRVNVQFETRSPLGIFRFLGDLLRNTQVYRVKASPQSIIPLLVISNKGDESCFAQVFTDRRYCVPSEGSDDTKQIFSMLSELIALNIKPGDLPVTPQVQVAP